MDAAAAIPPMPEIPLLPLPPAPPKLPPPPPPPVPATLVAGVPGMHAIASPAAPSVFAPWLATSSTPPPAIWIAPAANSTSGFVPIAFTVLPPLIEIVVPTSTHAWIVGVDV